MFAAINELCCWNLKSTEDVDLCCFCNTADRLSHMKLGPLLLGTPETLTLTYYHVSVICSS